MTTTGVDESLLVVRDLTVRFPTHDGLVQAVTSLSFEVERGRTLGIVGESGSGKSVAAMAVVGLHDPRRTRMSGSVRLAGREIVGMDEARLRRVRGNEAAMIFQDPLSALHPFYSVGAQLAEAYLAHHAGASRRQARARAVDLLGRVGIPRPRARADDYPHQFSGGMRQRAMIAMALINDPVLLIADEPTTALDVTVQAQILDLLQELQRDFDSAIVLITHDLGVVAEIADDVLVMYAGRCVEYGPCRQVLTRPEMPYTWGLLSSVPDLGAGADVRLPSIRGNPPSLLDPPGGCAFHPRCDYRDKVAGDLCATTLPELAPVSDGIRRDRHPHLKRCHLAGSEGVFRAEGAADA